MRQAGVKGEPTGRGEPKAEHGEVAAAGRAARLVRADVLVKDHMRMSLAAGLIPAPALDLAASMAIQLALLKRLCTLYDVPFAENVARGVIMSIVGGAGAGALGVGLFFSGGKLLPGLGTLAGAVSTPIAIAAIMYALGKLFLAHLEVGGGPGGFRPAANRAYLRDLLQRGRRAATDLVSSESRPVATS